MIRSARFDQIFAKSSIVSSLYLVGELLKNPASRVLTDTMVTLQAGDLVRIAFTATLDSTNSVFESTDDRVAKASGIYSDKVLYGPRLVIYGRGFMIPGLEEGLVQIQTGQAAKIHVPFEKAFGPRIPDLVRVMNEKELRDSGVQPFVGLILNIDGVQARVKSVSSGRVMLDFNHPLANENVTYHLELLEVITDPAQKAKALGTEYHTSLKIDKNGEKSTILIPAILGADRARSLAVMLQASLGDWAEIKIDQ